MAVKVKTWVWVVVAVLVTGVLFIIAMAGAGAYFIAKNLDKRTVTHTHAASEFDAVRAKFTGQKPLIELDEDGDFLRSNVHREAPPGVRRPETLHVMAFDPDDGSLVNLKIPFWLLRMKMNSAKVSFGDDMNLEDLRLTVEDLDRFGPTLVLDQRNRGGDRVLVWSE